MLGISIYFNQKLWSWPHITKVDDHITVIAFFMFEFFWSSVEDEDES